jgi:hypothetical protein
LARIGIATMNSVTPTRPPNNADGRPCPSANQDLAPDELEANIVKAIDEAGRRTSGTVENNGTLAAEASVTLAQTTRLSVSTTDMSAEPSPDPGDCNTNFPDGGLDDSLISELGILTDPPLAVHLQPEANATLLHAMSTLKSFSPTTQATTHKMQQIAIC